MKDVLAQWSLQEVIDAKIDRRLELLAEVHSIERELAAAGITLTEMPSVREAQQEAAVSRFADAHPAPAVVQTPVGEVPVQSAVPIRRRVNARGRLVTRTCACGAAFECQSNTNKRKCPDCRRVAAVANIAAARAVRDANKIARSGNAASAKQLQSAARQLGYQPTDVH